MNMIRKETVHQVRVCEGCPPLPDQDAPELVSRLRSVIALVRSGGYIRAPVTIEPVPCLRACLAPAAVSVSAENKRPWLFGGIEEPRHVDALADFIRLYTLSDDGSVDRSLFSEHLLCSELPQTIIKPKLDEEAVSGANAPVLASDRDKR